MDGQGGEGAKRIRAALTEADLCLSRSGRERRCLRIAAAAGIIVMLFMSFAFEVIFMSKEMPMRIIARIHNDFSSKFGIPRQSGLVDSLISTIVFEPEFRNPDAFRGLDGYSHIWLLWQFSEAVRRNWSPTVRPPRLGGNTRMGVFATRSPFRPNAIGLSCVRLEKVGLHTAFGPVLYVAGADLMDGSPIFDIKPYLAYCDSHPEALEGFTGAVNKPALHVEFPQELLERLPQGCREGLLEILAQDPRPGYQNEPNRVYGMTFAGFEIGFTVAGTILTVCRVEENGVQ